MSDLTFLGFPRPDGSVGIRNHVLVIGSGLVAQRICEFVPGTRTLVSAKGGPGFTSRDRESIARVLIGLGRNPNVAAVIVQGGNPRDGYPELRTERIAAEIAESGKQVELIDAEAAGGTLEAIARGIRIAREMVFEASMIRREAFPLGKLGVGVKCGASDPTSGMVGNPVMGYLYDRIVAAGGVAMFGETTEIIGAEHVLVERAATPEIARQIVEAARFIEERALATGEDIRTVNPVPANIKAGITTLEEKSLGAIHKAGTAAIQGVLKYAERPTGRGLYFVDNWMNVPSIFTGYAAAGAQLVLYQYGGGGVSGKGILDPSPAVVSPLLWCSANPRTAAATAGSLDFYSGTVIAGRETVEEAGERLLQVVLDTASGTVTRGETVNYCEPTDIYTLDPVF